MRADVLCIDPAGYRSHTLHGGDRVWTETNCAADLWIETLHALGYDPVAGLGFALASDFDGDQWRMFTYPAGTLRSLYGLEADELNVWRPLREHVVAAAYRDAADRAGPALAADVATLRRLVPTTADVTVLGHSYGGSIVGSAVAHGLQADRVVHVSSAGTYVAHPAAGGPQVYSMTAPDDPIQLAQGHDLRDAPQHLAQLSPPALAPAAAALGFGLQAVVPRQQIGHGADPDVAPGVVRLDTGRYDDSCRLVRGHSEVFTPGTTAWRNLLATMTGRPVQVLEPVLWRTHLEPWSVEVDGGAPRFEPPRYVVDRTPWSDPYYVAPRWPSRPPR